MTLSLACAVARGLPKQSLPRTMLSVRSFATVPPTPASDSSPAAESPPAPSTQKTEQGANDPSQPSEASLSSDASGTRGRRKKSFPTRRPQISLEHPREWRRALAPGVLPAYDEALRYIREDSKAIQAEAAQLRDKLEKGEFAEAQREEETKRLEILNVMGMVNLPEVRWKTANGMADLNQPVYRHLVEQRWRSEGALDLLMERVHQMHVIPDVVQDLHPTVDLRIRFPEPPPESAYLRSRVKRKYTPIEPGIFLLNEQTRKPPKLYTTVFHTDTRLYTLLMVDPDVPNEANESFATYLHWLIPNIPLSTASTVLEPPPPHMPYIPPHPAKGTPYHRYVLLLLPQLHPTDKLRLPATIERDGFDTHAFVAKHGLIKDGGKGGAIHMWRSVWDEESSRIWREVLKTPEPRYGRLPQPDRYAELRTTKKYAVA